MNAVISFGPESLEIGSAKVMVNDSESVAVLCIGAKVKGEVAVRILLTESCLSVVEEAIKRFRSEVCS